MPASQVCIRVLVCDANRLVSDALAASMGLDPEIEIVGERPATGLEALEAVLRVKPDVALLDYWMPEMDGPALTRGIIQRAPEVKVLLMSWFHGRQEVGKAMESGAVGFLPKSLTLETVVEAIKRAYAGESPVYGAALMDLIDKVEDRVEKVDEVRKRLATLTPREIRVLEVLSFGRPLEEVAEALYISPATVRSHIRNILEKTGARSQMEAISLARRYGIIQL